MLFDVRELMDRSSFISFRCEMEWSVPVVVSRMNISVSGIDERDAHVRVAPLRGQVERSPTEPVLGLDVRVSF